MFIKCVNLPYLLIHIFVLLTYAAGEFSILSGWEFVQSAIEREIKVTPKTLMAAFFAVVVPVALFFMSIIFGYTSYARIQHPEEVLYDEEYGLRKFYDEKTEGSETNTEIDAELSPQGGEEPYWKEPSSDANPRRRGIPFWKSKKTKTEEAKVFWLDYANYIFAEHDRTFLFCAEISAFEVDETNSERFEQSRYLWRLMGKKMLLVSAAMAGQLLKDEAEWDNFQTTLSVMAIEGTSVLKETSPEKYDFSSMPKVESLDAELLPCEIDYESLGRHLLKAVSAFLSSNNREALDDLVDVYVQAFELFGVDHDRLRVRGENIFGSARLSLLKHF